MESGGPKPGGGEAVLRFTTKLPAQFKVPEEDLVVPSSLARYGLSEVVNRLLNLEKPVPFDFLIDGEFLRSSVIQYLEVRKLSSEQVLNVEYVFALSEPEQKEVDETPDWICSLVPLQKLPSPWFAAASFDGTVRLYEGTESRATVRLCDAGLTHLAALSIEEGKGGYLVGAGQDGSLRCAALKIGSAPAIGSPATLPGPSCQSAQAAAISEDGTLLAGAGWSHEVLVWNAEPDLFAAPSSSTGSAVKRKKPSGEGPASHEPKFRLQGHTQVVSSLLFGASDRFPFTLLSGSWDCSVRVWDIAAASCVCNWPVARAVTSFSISPITPPQIATSHEDGHVSLWDVRAPQHRTVPGAVSLDASAGLPLASAQTPHRRLASQVVWNPEDSTRIASVGHDGQLCILDPRSPKMPLQSIRIGNPGPLPTKLLCVAWVAKDALALGGSDGRVVRVSLAAPQLGEGS